MKEVSFHLILLLEEWDQKWRPIVRPNMGRLVAPSPFSCVNVFFIKIGRSRPLFVHFGPFLITISIIQIEKSFDGVLGIRTHGHRMEDTDETIKVWRPPWMFGRTIFFYFHLVLLSDSCILLLLRLRIDFRPRLSKSNKRTTRTVTG